MRLLDLVLRVVLVHLREVVALLIQVHAHRVPPGGEVLPDRLAQVRAVRRRLAHQVMESWCRPLPVAHLNRSKLSEDHGKGEAQEFSMGS